jgi:hypothetical protein
MSEFQNNSKTFFETFPLLRKMYAPVPDYLSELFNGRIDIHCDICDAVTPFREVRLQVGNINQRSGTSKAYGPHEPRLTSGTYDIEGRCTGCEKSFFKCWYEVSVEESWVRKLGQSPPWSKPIPREVKKELGDDAALYSKALTLLSQSYGIGACAYMRRVIETNVDSMLGQIARLRELQGLGEPAEAVEALKGKNFTKKIEAAIEALPASLLIDGVNPVKLIYEKLSVSLHSLPDNEAVEIATALQTAYEYVVIELRRQLTAKEKFIETMRGLV